MATISGAGHFSLQTEINLKTKNIITFKMERVFTKIQCLALTMENCLKPGGGE